MPAQLFVSAVQSRSGNQIGQDSALIQTRERSAYQALLQTLSRFEEI